MLSGTVWEIRQTKEKLVKLCQDRLHCIGTTILSFQKSIFQALMTPIKPTEKMDKVQGVYFVKRTMLEALKARQVGFVIV